MVDLPLASLDAPQQQGGEQKAGDALDHLIDSREAGSA